MTRPGEVATADVLFISLDSCRYDTLRALYRRGAVPHLAALGPLHKAMAPSYFTYGSHAAFWMGFTPGVVGSSVPLLNPKVAKLFSLKAGGRQRMEEGCGFELDGANVIDGFRRKGYSTIGSGAVGWFDTTTDTGAVLAQPFDKFQFAGDCWSLHRQLAWINDRLQELPPDQPCFLFLNVGETHIPYWHEGAGWPRWPSPCEPFGGSSCSAWESRRRQRACLEWVDQQLAPLLQRFSAGTVLVCADHGDCWGESGLWAHGISHPATLTVPLILRLRGEPVHA